jgi:predicted ferric reductase
MATGNMALVVFLGLKNTPLAFLTAYSYERLNGLHQIAGYTALIQTFIHGVIYVYYFASKGRWETLHEDIVIVSYVLGPAIVITCLAGGILRHLNYESFYIIHVMLFVVILITLGLHRPSFDSDKVLIVTVLMAGLWFSDRLLRAVRLIVNSINNEATLHPLPNGGTRIVLKKPLLRARPGKHCFVWLPKIRAIETHPFTIVSSEPMELVINTYSGFTRDLHRFATDHPGASIKVSVEGPYGTFPDPMDYDKVLLVAGGSGATFTFGLAVNMLKRMSETSKQRMEFIWAVRGHGKSLHYVMLTDRALLTDPR